MKILDLFITFFKIGAFTFGGGYAMIPLIQHETVEKKHWLTDEEILEIVAIAESTPGPIAINSATFVGYKVAGVFGSVAATLGVVLPSFIVISILSFIISAFKENKYVRYAFFGIRAGVLALILKALISMFKKSEKNMFSYCLMGVAFLISAFSNINVIFIILFCAVTGLIYYAIKNGDKVKK